MDKYVRQLSGNTFFVAVLGSIFLYFLYSIRVLVMLLIITFILVVALRPFVRTLEEHKLHPVLATLITAAATVAVIGGLLWLIFIGISGQIGAFSTSFNDALGMLPFTDSIGLNVDFESIVRNFVGGTNHPFATLTKTVAGFVVAVVTTIVISIYWLIDYEKVKQYILSKFHDKKRANMSYRNIEQHFGSWVRGQLIISLVIGTLSYIAYALIGLPAAIALAVIAGLLEIIPTLGPILAAVPAVLIGFTVSPQTALIVLIANLAIQQLENHVIAPKVLQHTVHLHPIAIIVVLYIGSQLGGLLGVLLAVPITLLIISIKEGYRQKPAASTSCS